MHFAINVIIVILLLSIAGFFVFLIREKVKNTLWYRTRQVFKHAEKRKKEEQKLYEKYEDRTSEEEKKQMIHELRKKGNVKIPYAAFDYIYRHIDEFGIVSKDGKIILTNEEAYKRIISSIDNKQNRFMVKNKNDKLIPGTYFDVSVGENGAKSTRDFITGTITFESAKGDVYIAKGYEMVTIKKSKDEQKKDNENKQNNNTEEEGSDNSNDLSSQDILSADKIPSPETSGDKKTEKNEKKEQKKNTLKKLEEKALKNLLEESSQKDKNKDKKDKPAKQKKKDEFEDIDISNILEEMDNRDKDETDTTNSNTQHKDVKNIAIEENEETNNEEILESEENTTEIEKSFEEGYTINNFFQRRLYFGNDAEKFCASLSEENILKFLIDLFTFSEKYYSYPVIVRDNEVVYIDSSFFFIALSKIIVKDDEADFLEKMFMKKGSYLADLINSICLLRTVNNILIKRTTNNLFKIWKNQDEQDVCISKKSFNYNHKDYTSLFLLVDVSSLKRLKIDVEQIAKVELQEKIPGAYMLTKAIFKQSQKS